MKLNKRQVAYLQRAIKFRDNPPTLRDVLFSGLWKYLYMLALCGGLSILLYQFGYIVLSAFVVGYFVGVIYRDLQWVNVTNKLWPVSSEVTNWQRVEEILAQNIE